MIRILIFPPSRIRILFCFYFFLEKHSVYVCPLPGIVGAAFTVTDPRQIDADPNPAFPGVAVLDPDPIFYFNVDPDLTRSPSCGFRTLFLCGSGSL
jgi:hypothetical protein